MQMGRDSSSSSESQLDALIARIHGLSSAVGLKPSSKVNLGNSGKTDTPDLATETDVAPPEHGSQDSPPEYLAGPNFRDRVPTRETLAHIVGRSPEKLPEKSPPISNDSGSTGEPRDLRVTAQERPNSNFTPSRDEPWRPMEPQTLKEAGIRDTTVEQLTLKYMLARGEVEGRQVADQLKIPFRLVEPVLEWLKMQHSVAHRRGTATGDFAYVLTDKGRIQARSFNTECTYFGACPVRLEDYVASVKHQSVESQKPQKNRLEQAFSDLLINPQMIDRLGPAVNSGRGMFLYGFPGNGKTSIAERVTAAFGKWIWIPRAVDVDGDILRLFDRMNHEADMPQATDGFLDQSGIDKRWIRIRRPTIVVGGELTMEMLEVQSNSQTNISEAPLQMKSNCGTLVIDDFGRQKMSIDQLLNRWIVPLEKRFDYLNMRSGKKIQVPFDQLVIFSTNLEPRDLVDDAFLRRIPYKIEVKDPSEGDFRKLFEIMCRVLKIPYQPGPIDYLIQKHYKPINRPFRNCQPRDLLLQVQNYCRYQDREVELREDYFDYAVENYFSIM
jgi:hypothetical protein